MKTIDPLAAVRADPRKVKHLRLNPAASRNAKRGDYAPLPALPKEIFACTNLETLEVFRGVSGTIVLPPALGKLTRLRVLRLGGTRLAEFPPALGKLTRLEELVCHYVDGITSLPAAIGKLRALHTIAIGGASFTTLPATIGGCRALRSLGIGTSGVREIPKTLWKATRLDRLWLPDGVRALPPGIGALQKLKVLRLTAPALASIRSELGKLKALRELVVVGRGGLPDEVGLLANLVRLEAVGVGLTAIPPTFVQLKKLKKLNLAQNPLATAVSLIVQLPALVELSLAETAIPRPERTAILALMKLAPKRRRA